MRTVLFLSASPLHSLWALALASGPFVGERCVLWTVVRPGAREDFIAEALRRSGAALFAEVRAIEHLSRKSCGGVQPLRNALAALQARVRALRPDLILTANDGHQHFHAIVHAAPAARAAYLDDGTASYAPAPRKSLGAVRRLGNLLWRWHRRYRYGFPEDRPERHGASPRVREAWVAFPQHVHGDLRSKSVRALDPAWLRTAAACAVCREAVRLAGLDVQALSRVELVLVLPRDSQLDLAPELRSRFEALAREVLGRGASVAIKRHPRSSRTALNLPADRLVEIPHRLPLELVAPLLGRARVIGTLTSALIYLRWLQAGTRVEALVPATLQAHPVLRLYRALGIPLLVASP